MIKFINPNTLTHSSETWKIDGFDMPVDIYNGTYECIPFMLKRVDRSHMFEKIDFEIHLQRQYWLAYVDLTEEQCLRQDELYFYGGITYGQIDPGFAPKGMVQLIQSKLFKCKSIQSQSVLESGLYRVGCDFSHGWDENFIYPIEFVLLHMSKTIESIINLK